MKGNFVNLSDRNVTAILEAYPSTNEPVNPRAARYETSGLGPGTAVNVSAVATGQQQRAFVGEIAMAQFKCTYWVYSFTLLTGCLCRISVPRPR
jgi:hypothetical protein